MGKVGIRSVLAVGAIVSALAPAAASGRTFEVTKRGDPAPGACTRSDC